MSPFLQLRIVLRPRNTPRLSVMPRLVVPFASRQQLSSMTTLSSIEDLVRMPQDDVAAERDVAADAAENQRIQLRAQEQPERARHPGRQQHGQLVANERPQPRLADDEIGVALPLRSARAELPLDVGDARISAASPPASADFAARRLRRRAGGSAEPLDADTGVVFSRGLAGRAGHVSRLGLADFLDHVGRLVLRLVVRARLHFGEQAERHELHAGEDQQDPEQQERPVARSPAYVVSRT